MEQHVDALKRATDALREAESLRVYADMALAAAKEIIAEHEESLRAEVAARLGVVPDVTTVEPVALPSPESGT